MKIRLFTSKIQKIINRFLYQHMTVPNLQANIKDNPQLLDLQTKEDCSRHKEEDDKLKSPDQQFIMYVSPTEVEQSIFNIEINEDSLQLLDLQMEGSCNNHEEHQKDYFTPSEPFVSDFDIKTTYDEEEGDIFPNLFQDQIADFSIHKSSFSPSLDFIMIFHYLINIVMMKKILKIYYLLKFHLVLPISKDMIRNICRLWPMIAMKSMLK
jgi:hypothetical protein